MNTIPAYSDLMNSLLDSFIVDGGLDLNTDLMEPYDASAGVKVDPGTAWGEVQAIGKLCGVMPSVGTVPFEWSSIAFADSTLVALPCAMGLYPQQMNDIPRLLKTVQVRQLPKTVQNNLSPTLRERLTKKMGEDLLLAVGVARLAGAFDLAQELLNRCSGIEAWVRGNEVAATLWMRGQHAEALKVWKIQPGNAIVLLNRGMAELFLNQRDAARKDLQSAIAALPENSGWIHLAQLYLSLCDM